MDSGRDQIAPQFRTFTGIKKSAGPSDTGLPDSHESDVTKAALPQPVSKSRKD